MDRHTGIHYLCQPSVSGNSIQTSPGRYLLVSVEKVAFFSCKCLASFNLDHQCGRIVREHFEPLRNPSSSNPVLCERHLNLIHATQVELLDLDHCS